MLPTKPTSQTHPEITLLPLLPNGQGAATHEEVYDAVDPPTNSKLLSLLFNDEVNPLPQTHGRPLEFAGHGTMLQVEV